MNEKRRRPLRERRGDPTSRTLAGLLDDDLAQGGEQRGTPGMGDQRRQGGARIGHGGRERRHQVELYDTSRIDQYPRGS